jgi:predicted SAM-dependent methyltransferase
MMRAHSVEALRYEPPYGKALLTELGLRGLNVGCGASVHAGWLNVDVGGFVDEGGNATPDGLISLVNDEVHFLQHDAAMPLPIDDASFDWAYSEHMLEHLTPAQGVAWLRDMRRLLRQGGHLRITTPDLRRYVEGYLDPERTFFSTHSERLSGLSPKVVRRQREQVGEPPEDLDHLPDRPAWMFNQIFRFWAHRWVYDLEEVRHFAARAGFGPECVTECAFRRGREPRVAALDYRSSDETLYVEIARD